MIIEIMSREKLWIYSSFQNDLKSAVISISYCNEDQLNLQKGPDNGIEAICRVSFDDVEIGMTNCITDDDAEKMSSFVNGIIDKKDKLIVQCGAGVSRSAGVAAAIMKHYANNDMLVWGNPRYRPNKTCYRKVLVAFNEVIDEQELAEKLSINRNFGFEACGESASPDLILLSNDEEEMRI